MHHFYALIDLDGFALVKNQIPVVVPADLLLSEA